MSPWQEWKKRNLEAQQQGKVGPSALLNPDTPEVDDETQQSRLAICNDCPFYMASKQCSQCGCFMPLKTKLLHASCPKGKW
jgi:hypothetical protein